MIGTLNSVYIDVHFLNVRVTKERRRIMGLRFRKSIKIAPGVKLNLNKKSMGVSVGTRGAHYSINSKGKKTATVGLPGTGISYTKSSGGGNTSSGSSNSSSTSSSGSNNGSGCVGCLMTFLVVCLAIAILGFIFKYAWIPGIIAIVYFAIKTPDKKQKIIRIGIAAAITLFSLIFCFTADKQPSSINVNWGKQEFDINETVELKITCEPEDASINSLSISDNDIASLEYSDGKAIISFKNEGTESIYFTANGSVNSDATTITVIDKEAQAEREREEAERKAAEEAEKQAELEAQKQAELEAQQKAAEQSQEPQEEMVWIPSSGSKYHSNSSCSGMKNPRQVTLSEAKSKGYTPCKRCH